MQHDPNALTQVTDVALPAELTEPLPDDARTVTIVARTAAETALDVPGVHHLGGIAAGAADQLRKQLGRSAGTAGVQVDEDDGALGVQVSVVVSYPAPVIAVADEVRKQVSAATRQVSDVPTTVDVRVLDVHGPFDDEPSALGRAAEATGDAVKQAVEATSEATKRAATATADATKRTAEVTADAAKRLVDGAADTADQVGDAAAAALARSSELAAGAAESAKDAAAGARDAVTPPVPADRAAAAADAAGDAADAAQDAADAAESAAGSAAAVERQDRP